ncbi:MAG: hypothetical protein DWQ11_15550 [Proteobacteria bacterium]|nr:MAG: hypothetical protein DWQ11_15550 [Pseudomonadota bacterium]
MIAIIRFDRIECSTSALLPGLFIDCTQIQLDVPNAASAMMGTFPHGTATDLFEVSESNCAPSDMHDHSAEFGSNAWCAVIQCGEKVELIAALKGNFYALSALALDVSNIALIKRVELTTDDGVGNECVPHGCRLRRVELLLVECLGNGLRCVVVKRQHRLVGRKIADLEFQTARRCAHPCGETDIVARGICVLEKQLTDLTPMSVEQGVERCRFSGPQERRTGNGA